MFQPSFFIIVKSVNEIVKAAAKFGIFFASPEHPTGVKSDSGATGDYALAIHK